jgi:3-oxoacyl-[acyl-carrier-protein] synthase-3
MTQAAEKIKERNNLKAEEISYLVPHQANKRIVDATADRIGLKNDQVLMNIAYYGNTTAATIPLLLNDYKSKFNKGDKLVFAAFGGGFTWGAAYLTWAY